MLWQHFCLCCPFKGQKMQCECVSSITPLKAFQSYLQDIMWIFPTCTLEEQQQNFVAAQQSSVQAFSGQQNSFLVNPVLSNSSKVFDSCLWWDEPGSQFNRSLHQYWILTVAQCNGHICYSGSNGVQVWLEVTVEQLLAKINLQRFISP